MAELIRGTVFDRPWGRTLATIGARGVTGQLTMAADGKQYEIAFSNGAIIGATSPIASDAAVRIALTGGLVSTTQVAELARKQAASPGRDEVDVITEHLRLGTDQSMRLRRRTIAQRAARSFSVDKGEFVVTHDIRLPIVPGSELDVRSIIYLGARQNLSESRLASELGLFGTWFRLKPESFDDLPYFGFTDAERPILDQLLNGASLGELEEIAGMDPRMIRATLYALASANACNIEQTRGQSTKPPPVRPGAGSDPGMRRGGGTSNPGFRRAGTSNPGVRPTPPQAQPAVQPIQPAPRTRAPSSQPIVAYNPGIRRGSKSAPPPNTTSTPASAPLPRAQTQPPATTPSATRATTPPATAHATTTPAAAARTTTPPATTPAAPSATARGTSPTSRTTGSPTTSPATAATTAPGTPARASAPTAAPRTTAPTSAPRSAASSSSPSHKKLAGADEVKQLIGARAKLLDQGTDHYALLGVAPTASPDDIRKTYFNLARNLHPDRLAALNIPDDAHVAHKVFAQLNTAFAILSDVKRRAEYDALLGRGGEEALAEEQARAEELTMRILQAEEAFKRGEIALKRDDIVNAIPDLAKAVELNPDEPDFYATHAWALFCAASDKATVARQTRATLERAIQRSPRAINPRFYLGRVERMLGRDKEALDLFRDVLVDKPHHHEAQSEVRAIEQRLASSNAPKGGGGLFGRKR